MNPLRRLVEPFRANVLERRVEAVTAPRFDQLSGQIDAVRETVVEVRRLLTDDMDAATETAALLGRSLAALQDAVAELRAELAALREAAGR